MLAMIVSATVTGWLLAQIGLRTFGWRVQPLPIRLS
jgi:hypothetical protein